MPRVPVLDAPSAQQSPLPALSLPSPQAAAFGGQVGDEVKGLAHVAGEYAADEYGLAVRQQASEAENDALNKMIQLRTDYANKFGKDATDSHSQVLEAMEKIYNDSKASIPSRRGQLLFEANAMRSKRIELSVIETHFATERRARRVADYKAAIAAGTFDLANLATGMGKDDLSTEVLKKNIEVRLNRLRVSIAQEAEDRGIDPASREAFIDRELAAPVQGMLNGLMHSKHPELRDAFQQYGGYLKGGAQGTVYRVMNALEVDQTVRGMMGGMKRYDAGGVGPAHEDEHGSIPEEEVQSALAQIKPDDPNYTAIKKQLYAEVKQDDEQHLRAGHQLQDRVDKLGQKRGRDGSWAVPYGTKDWNDLERLYPTLAKVEESKEAAQSRVKTRFQQEQEHYASTHARGASLEEIGRRSDEQVQRMKYEDVASMVKRYSPSASGSDIEAVWKHVQDRANDKLDPIAKGMSKIVQGGLKDAFGRDAGTARDLEPDARAYADDLYAASKDSGKKLNEDDLRKAVTLKARELSQDSSFFNKRSALKGYRDQVKPAKKAPDEQVDFEWDPVLKKSVPVKH